MHRVFNDQVGVANFADSYEGRLQRAWPVWKKLRLWVPEPHDLALTKLERSNERDIRDVMFLAQAGLISRGKLMARFEGEMEPYLRGPTPTWHRTALNMWIEACWPEKGSIGLTLRDQLDVNSSRARQQEKDFHLKNRKNRSRKPGGAFSRRALSFSNHRYRLEERETSRLV
jgi:hypothetical protein